MKKAYLFTLLTLLTLLGSGRIILHLFYQPEQSSMVVTTEPSALPKSIDHAIDQMQRVSRTTAEAIPDVIAEAEAAGTTGQNISSEEREMLLSLRTIREHINKQEAELENRIKTAKEAEKRAGERITELEKLEKRIENMLEQENSIKNKKIKRLTAVYEGMKPEKAALVIANMELKTVVKMFLRMDEKKVGKILSFLPTAKAVRVSQALTKRISSVNLK